MRIREHFLLGTEQVTISVTAKNDTTRSALFETAIGTILTRFQEEFGKEQCGRLIKRLGAIDVEEPNWRLHPDDSCWNQAQPSPAGNQL